MEAENQKSQYAIQGQKLSKEYPTIPLWKIIKCLQKYSGDIPAVQLHLKTKQQKIKNKTKLTQEDISILIQEFSKFPTDFIYKKLSKVSTIQQGRILLKDLEARGRNQKYIDKSNEEVQNIKEEQPRRKHRHRHRRHSKQHKKQHSGQKKKGTRNNEQQQLDTYGVFVELKKLFPNVEDGHIRYEIDKICKKLSRSSKSKQKKNHPQNYEQNVKFICQATGLNEKQIRRQFQELNYNVDGTIQCLLSQQGIRLRTLMQISPSLTDLYIDGNNLLYVNRSIRNITLQKGKNAGSLALSKVLNQFNKIYKKNVVLIFDQQKGIQQFQFIKVQVSRPKYSSSDDYLVEIGQKMTSEKREISMFVTSDNKLLQRLGQAKCENLMKGKIFMSILEQKINNIEEKIK